MDELDPSPPDYFLLSAFGFLMGIALESFLRYGISFGILFVVVPLLGRLIGVTSRAVVVFCFCILVGVSRMSIWSDAYSSAQASLVPQSHVVLEGRVASLPERGDRNALYEMELSNGYFVRVYAPLYPEARYGDHVSFTSDIRLPRRAGTSWIGEVSNPTSYVVWSCEPECGVRARLVRTRGFLVDQVRSLFPEPHASLGVGIIAGRDSMPESIADTFRTAGLSHVVVLSGYNVAMVARVLGEGYLGIVAVLFFVLSTGAEPSVVRAALMTLLVVLARKGGRRYDAGRGLLIAGVLMVIFSPRLLVYDLSFQLSFLATLGIVYVYPILFQKLQIIPQRFFLREGLALTLAAQVTVLPLILFTFGELSLVSLISNVLLVPVVPYAMAFVLFAGVLSFFSVVLAKIVSLPAYTLLAYLVSGSEIFAALPFASVVLSGFGVGWLVVSYGLLAAWFFLARQKHNKESDKE